MFNIGSLLCLLLGCGEAQALPSTRVCNFTAHTYVMELDAIDSAVKSLSPRGLVATGFEITNASTGDVVVTVDQDGNIDKRREPSQGTELIVKGTICE